MLIGIIPVITHNVSIHTARLALAILMYISLYILNIFFLVTGPVHHTFLDWGSIYYQG